MKDKATAAMWDEEVSQPFHSSLIPHHFLSAS